MGLITYENLEDGQKVTANIFNERFAQIVAQLNGHIGEVNLEDNGISKEKLQAEVYEAMYPIGSAYINFTNNTNPATLLGFGTWTAIAGRTIVGYDGTQTEFNAAEKIGGHKKMQAHSHLQYPINYGFTPSGADVIGGTHLTSPAVANTAPTSTTGEGDSENLPPYIVGYIWKRVS